MFAAADIYVTASKWEGFDLPLVEAQRAGAPVVAALGEAVEGLGAAGIGVDYFAVVEADTMRPVGVLAAPGGGPARLVAAGRLGTVRLLDTMAVPSGPAPGWARSPWSARS